MNCVHGIDMAASCKSCGPDYRTVVNPGQGYAHALNCPCDQCRPDLATRRSNQAFHAELVKLNRNVEGLTGMVEKLAKSVGLQANVEMAKVNLGQLEEQTKRFEKVEPKKAEGSNERGLWSFSSDHLRNELWQRNGEVVPQQRVLAPMTLDEAYDFLIEMNARNDAPLGITPTQKTAGSVLGAFEHFARSRGLMP